MIVTFRIQSFSRWSNAVNGDAVQRPDRSQCSASTPSGSDELSAVIALPRFSRHAEGLNRRREPLVRRDGHSPEDPLAGCSTRAPEEDGELGVVKLVLCQVPQSKEGLAHVFLYGSCSGQSIVSTQGSGW